MNIIARTLLLLLIFSKYQLTISQLPSSSEIILPNYQNDTTTLADILRRGMLLEKMNTWSGKLLIVKVDDVKNPPVFHKFYYQSLFVDRNNNSWQDEADAGFFNPASTVKIGIAALVLEKLHQLGLGRETKYQIVGESNWYDIYDDIRSSLVISDNDATNRLILFLGFDLINQKMKAKGLQHFIVNRLMLNQGVLVDSPAFNLSFGDRVIQQERQVVFENFPCYEIDKNLGNCATADDLVGVLIRIVEPEYFSSTEGFNLRDSDRFWLQKIMSQTPRSQGFNYADNYCRFLSEVELNWAGNSGRMLSKCGVGFFTNTYVDNSLIETDYGRKYYIVLAVTPPNQFPKLKLLVG
ncbi:MAG: serine hydrolase [Trichodesmium sp.]